MLSFLLTSFWSAESKIWLSNVSTIGIFVEVVLLVLVVSSCWPGERTWLANWGGGLEGSWRGPTVGPPGLVLGRSTLTSSAKGCLFRIRRNPRPNLLSFPRRWYFFPRVLGWEVTPAPTPASKTRLASWPWLEDGVGISGGAVTRGRMVTSFSSREPTSRSRRLSGWH